MPLSVADTEIMENIRQDQDIVLMPYSALKKSRITAVILKLSSFSPSKACLPKMRIPTDWIGDCYFSLLADFGDGNSGEASEFNLQNPRTSSVSSRSPPPSNENILPASRPAASAPSQCPKVGKG